MSERREILFRGKQVDNGEWVYGYYVLNAYLLGTIEEEIYPTIHPTIDEYKALISPVDPLTVGQYTGLTDRNGKRIFEGDIVTLDGEDGYFLLKWDEYGARFEMSGDGLAVDFDNFYPHEVEIVGNVHDNLDLLEGRET